MKQLNRDINRFHALLLEFQEIPDNCQKLAFPPKKQKFNIEIYKFITYNRVKWSDCQFRRFLEEDQKNPFQNRGLVSPNEGPIPKHKV